MKTVEFLILYINGWFAIEGDCLMYRLRLISLIGILQLGFAGFGFAEEISRDGVDQLMVECQQQRQLHIAPLREEAIQRCIDGKRGDQEYCERFNRNYGERAANRPRGMFWHLPECDTPEQIFMRKSVMHICSYVKVAYLCCKQLWYREMQI